MYYVVFIFIWNIIAITKWYQVLRMIYEYLLIVRIYYSGGHRTTGYIYILFVIFIIYIFSLFSSQKSIFSLILTLTLTYHSRKVRRNKSKKRLRAPSTRPSSWTKSSVLDEPSYRLYFILVIKLFWIRSIPAPAVSLMNLTVDTHLSYYILFVFFIQCAPPWRILSRSRSSALSSSCSVSRFSYTALANDLPHAAYVLHTLSIII